MVNAMGNQSKKIWFYQEVQKQKLGGSLEEKLRAEN